MIPRDAVRRRPGDPYWIESLARGVAVLTAFRPDRTELRLAELAGAAGVTKASALRIGHTLTQLGYLTRDPLTRTYRLGVRALELGMATLASLSLPEIAQPAIGKLAEATGEIVNVTVLDDTDIVYVARIASRQLISINIHVGSRLPAYCTSMGRAILAFLPPNEARAILERSDRRAWTPYTRTEVSDLEAALAEVRRLGYAINDQELALGHRSVAAPLFDRAGEPVGAVNLSVPSARVSVEDLHHVLAPKLLGTADEISHLIAPGVLRVAGRAVPSRDPGRGG